MAKKTQTHSGPSADPSPEEFMKLWQEKWAEMMAEKGWPQEMAMPPMGQMPFFMPFMPGFSGFGAQQDDALLNRINELEKRLAKLEKQVAPKKPTAKTQRPLKK